MTTRELIKKVEENFGFITTMNAHNSGNLKLTAIEFDRVPKSWVLEYNSDYTFDLHIWYADED